MENKMKPFLITFLIVGIILGALVAWGISLAEAKTPTGSVKIQGVDYAKENYDILKADVIGKVENMKTKPLTYDEATKWVAVASQELLDCPISLKAGEDIVVTINNKMKNGCKADTFPVFGAVAVLAGAGGAAYGMYKIRQKKKI